jgi:ribosome-interacting GTPase 1
MNKDSRIIIRDVAKWLLDNKVVLEEFLDNGIRLMQWHEDLEYERKLVSGLDGSFKISFICPVHEESENICSNCNVELEFMLIRHNPISLKHVRYILEEPSKIVDEIFLLREDDFIHLENKDKMKIEGAKKLIYERLEFNTKWED